MATFRPKATPLRWQSADDADGALNPDSLRVDLHAATAVRSCIVNTLLRQLGSGLGSDGGFSRVGLQMASQLVTRLLSSVPHDARVHAHLVDRSSLAVSLVPDSGCLDPAWS